jgi:hypothetical protein
VAEWRREYNGSSYSQEKVFASFGVKANELNTFWNAPIDFEVLVKLFDVFVGKIGW